MDINIIWRAYPRVDLSYYYCFYFVFYSKTSGFKTIMCPVAAAATTGID